MAIGESRGSGSGETKPETLRAEIAQNRTEIGRTIDAIQAKLNPDTLREQATEAFREATVGRASRTINRATDLAEEAVYSAEETVKEAGITMMDTIRQNPIPSLLAGLGISWLFANRTKAEQTPRSRFDSTRSGYRRQESSSGLTDKLGDTAGRMQESGGEIISNAVGMVDDTRSSVGEVIGQNPIPSALVGLGLGWLFINRGSTHRDGHTYYGAEFEGAPYRQRSNPYANDTQDRVGEIREKTGQMADQAREATQDALGQVQATAGNVADEVQQRAGEVARQTRYQAGRVEDRFSEMLRSNPLAIGAAAVAVGALVGSLLPETERENELLGPTSENLMRQARSTAEETMEKVQRVAGEAQNTVERESRNQGLTG